MWTDRIGQERSVVGEGTGNQSEARHLDVTQAGRNMSLGTEGNWRERRTVRKGQRKREARVSWPSEVEARMTSDFTPGRRNGKEQANALSCVALLCIQAMSAETTPSAIHDRKEPARRRVYGPRRTVWYVC